MKKKPSFTFIDLFAGIGGMRLAFEYAGGKCVFSSEWDTFAAKTYRENFGELPSGDITKIETRQIPRHNILVAGFPCQPFSNAGLKLGFEDTRGTLFFDIARIIKARKPEMALLENVKGFAIHDRGKTHATVVRVLEDLGYTVHSAVLNASDFGVPQNRERIFMVAVRSDLAGHQSFKFPRPTNKKTRVGSILDAEVDPKYILSNKLWRGHQRRLREHRARGNGFGYSLFTPESIRTSTISARYYKDGSEILIETSSNPRRLTPREAARLQGFPESFRIPVSDTQAYKQFGNSVAVPVVRAIAKRMAALINQ